MEELRRMLELAHKKLSAYEGILQELEDDRSAEFCEDCHLLFFERLHTLRETHLVETPDLDVFLESKKYLPKLKSSNSGKSVNKTENAQNQGKRDTPTKHTKTKENASNPSLESPESKNQEVSGNCQSPCQNCFKIKFKSADRLAIFLSAESPLQENTKGRKRPTLLPHMGLMQAMKAVEKSRNQEGFTTTKLSEVVKQTNAKKEVKFR